MLQCDFLQSLSTLCARLKRSGPIAGTALCLYVLASGLPFSDSVSAPRAAEQPAVIAATPIKVDPPPAAAEPTTFHDIPVLDFQAAAETQSDVLRVLALHEPGRPAVPAVAPPEVNLLKEYAREAERELAWVLVDDAWDLLPALQSGHGDLIAGQDKAVRAGMDGQVEFTLPWTQSRQRVVGRRGSQPLDTMADLQERQIAVRQNSPALAQLSEYADEHPAMDLIRVSKHQPVETLLRNVSRGQYDLAVIGSATLEEHLHQYSELSVLFDLPGGDSMVWGVHPEADELRESLNQYLSREALSRSVADIRFEDLPRITERKTLRVITYQGPANYYLEKGGELRGFEYELIRKFAKRQGLRVEMVVAPSQEDMVRWLLEGRGDLIAASVPAPAVRNHPRLGVSRPYNYAAPLVVGREDEKTLIDARDLEGRRIVLPAGSPHKRLLKRYQDQGIEVEIVEADPGLTIADILYRVSAGIYDLTVIDSHKSRILLAGEPGTRVHFPISEPLPHAWVMREEDRQLLGAVNTFISDTYRSRDYNVLHARYFEHPVKFTPLQKMDNELLALGGELSPYDELARKYAERFGFDWRLIIAQMYQESRFDPAAVSTAGAIGLMQMLPTTANDIGAGQLQQPDSSIQAGVRYLRHLYDRFEDKLAFEDRVWFSLAAYNAGFQRVQQARERAREMGLDPDRWFDNVEDAMLTMAKNTSCQCGQPVVYVREIRARYNNYVRLTRAAQYAARERRGARRDT